MICELRWSKGLHYYLLPVTYHLLLPTTYVSCLMSKNKNWRGVSQVPGPSASFLAMNHFNAQKHYSNFPSSLSRTYKFPSFFDTILYHPIPPKIIQRHPIPSNIIQFHNFVNCWWSQWFWMISRPCFMIVNYYDKLQWSRGLESDGLVYNGRGVSSTPVGRRRGSRYMLREY